MLNEAVHAVQSRLERHESLGGHKLGQEAECESEDDLSRLSGLSALGLDPSPRQDTKPEEGKEEKEEEEEEEEEDSASDSDIGSSDLDEFLREIVCFHPHSNTHISSLSISLSLAISLSPSLSPLS